MNSRTCLAPQSAASVENCERMRASRYPPCTFCGSMIGTLRKADASCTASSGKSAPKLNRWSLTNPFPSAAVGAHGDETHWTGTNLPVWLPG